MEELRYHQQFMDGFFEAIRTSDDANVHHIIDVVRSGSLTSEIQTAVNRILTDNRSSYNDVPEGGPLSDRPKRKASKSATSDYLIAQLLDPSEIQSDGDSAQQPVPYPTSYRVLPRNISRSLRIQKCFANEELPDDVRFQMFYDAGYVTRYFGAIHLKEQSPQLQLEASLLHKMAFRRHAFDVHHVCSQSLALLEFGVGTSKTRISRPWSPERQSSREIRINIGIHCRPRYDTT